MKKLNKILVLYVLLSVLTVDNSYSQVSAESNGYNPLSLRQVHESYLMWKKTLWRRVDLKEKQNKPFFARNREISKIIIEAVERGVLIPYNSDSVNDSNVMAREEFIENIQQVDEEIEEEEEFGLIDEFGNLETNTNNNVDDENNNNNNDDAVVRAIPFAIYNDADEENS